MFAIVGLLGFRCTEFISTQVRDTGEVFLRGLNKRIDYGETKAGAEESREERGGKLIPIFSVLPVLTKSLERPNLPHKRFYWILAVGKLPHSHLSHKIDLLIEAVKRRYSLRSDAIERLEAILRSHPTEAPNILEARILKMDPEDVSLVGDLLSVFD